MRPQVRPVAGRVCATAVLVLSLAGAHAADAATISVPAGGDLQSAINSAQPGDVIALASGATYVGNFKLTVKSGNTGITIRTNAPAASLPAAGQRMDPSFTSALAKIKSGNTNPALATVDGAHNWRVENVEFQANANGTGDIITLGSSSQTDTSQMPHDLVLDRVYIHGDATVGQKRGIALNSGYTEITNSYIADIKSAGQDSQAICGWNGSGPYLIQNNYLEAAGENVLFGGADAAIWSMVPADITVRQNTISKPVSWRQEKWSVKNAVELKNARRVLVEGNVIENVWKSGQSGFAVVLTPRNQDGRAPWSVVEDVTIHDNIVRHAGGAFNLSGWDDLQPSAQMQRVQIADNVVYDIDSSWGGSGIFVQVGNSPASVVVEHNTVMNSGTVVNAYGTKNKAPWVIQGFAYRDNLSKHNTYGVFGDGQGVGNSALNAYFSGLVFEHNVLAGGDASRYPAGNYFPSVDSFNASFVNAQAGDLTLVPGSPYRTMGSNGGALGADVTKVSAAVHGAPAAASPSGTSSSTTPGTSSSSDGEHAVCRQGATCSSMAASSHWKP